MSDLPEGWRLCTISELAGTDGLVTDGDWIESKDQDQNGDVRLIQLADIGDGEFLDRSSRFLTGERARELQCTFLGTGDLLIARMPDPLGRACIFPGVRQKSVTAVDILIWRPGTHSAEPRWLMYAVNSPQTREHIRTLAGGTTRQRVSGGNLKRLALPTPPKPTQRRIVATLDRLTAKSRRARNELGRVPQLTERFKQAVLAAAFRGDLTVDWGTQTPHGVAQQMQGQWKQLLLMDLCDRERAITYGVIKLGDEILDGTPCLRTSNVRWLRVDTEGMKRISPALSLEYARTILRGGEVLVNVRGTLGGVAVATPEMAGWNVSREVAIVPVDTTRVDSAYLSYWIGSDTSQRWLTRVEKGVAYTGINLEDLRKLPVELPAIEEQREIVRRVGEAFSRIDVLAGETVRAATLLNNLDQAIVAKAFRGELVAQYATKSPQKCASLPRASSQS